MYFLRARHDHNKIAPSGMIKVFELNWCIYVSCCCCFFVCVCFYWHWRQKFLGHVKRHFGPQILQNETGSYLAKEANICNKRDFDYSLLMGESSVHDRLFCQHQQSGSVHNYSKTRSRSNVWKEHTHTEGHKCEERKKITFCCRFGFIRFV